MKLSQGPGQEGTDAQMEMGTQDPGVSSAQGCTGESTVGGNKGPTGLVFWLLTSGKGKSRLLQS